MCRVTILFWRNFCNVLYRYVTVNKLLFKL